MPNRPVTCRSWFAVSSRRVIGSGDGMPTVARTNRAGRCPSAVRVSRMRVGVVGWNDPAVTPGPAGQCRLQVSNPKQIASRSIVGIEIGAMSTLAVILRPVAVSVTNKQVATRPADAAAPLGAAARRRRERSVLDPAVALERCRRIRISGRDLERVDDHAAGRRSASTTGWRRGCANAPPWPSTGMVIGAEIARRHEVRSRSARRRRCPTRRRRRRRAPGTSRTRTVDRASPPTWPHEIAVRRSTPEWDVRVVRARHDVVAGAAAGTSTTASTPMWPGVGDITDSV